MKTVGQQQHHRLLGANGTNTLPTFINIAPVFAFTAILSYFCTHSQVDLFIVQPGFSTTTELINDTRQPRFVSPRIEKAERSS